MIYLKWLILAIIDIAMLLLTALPAAVFIPMFTRAQSYGKIEYTWGWIWGTYDNPPQGDEGYVSKRAPFIGATTGLKGYVNRVRWMIRNPLYGLARRMALPYSSTARMEIKGDTEISDKYGRPGWMFARLYESGKLIGFELYVIWPWAETKDVRIRFGWKMTTDKFKEKGFAQFVDTINPFDGYGESK